MKLQVLNIQGESTGREIELPENIFGIEPSEHAVYLAVKQYLANQRRGTHASKERNEVAGSTRKIKRQKGTGTARAGDIKSPIFRGGGRIFGPRPRNYGFRLNKKVKALAKRSVLTNKAGDGNIMIVEDFSFESPKTKEYLNILHNLKANEGKTLFVTADYEKEVYLSGRNLPKSRVVRVSDLNTYDILNSDKLLLSETAVDKIKEALA